VGRFFGAVNGNSDEQRGHAAAQYDLRRRRKTVRLRRKIMRIKKEAMCIKKMKSRPRATQ